MTYDPQEMTQEEWQDAMDTRPPGTDLPPPSENWRIVRRKVPLAGAVLQTCVVRGKDIIPIGPWCNDLDELRATLTAMLEACDKPILIPVLVDGN